MESHGIIWFHAWNRMESYGSMHGILRADLFVISSSNNNVFTPALIVSRNHNDNVQSTRKFLDDLVGPIQRQKHF